MKLGIIYNPFKAEVVIKDILTWVGSLPLIKLGFTFFFTLRSLGAKGRVHKVNML